MSPRKSGKKHAVKTLGDVTINDFANSAVPKSRPKKSNGDVKTVLKTEIEKSWDEKDEEYDGDFVEELNEDGTVSYALKQVEVRRRKKTISSSDSDKIVERCGVEYPIDVWFLLSDYLRPEDVGKFSRICRGSYEVINTARFWFNLYKRYYKSRTALPEKLQPEYLFRKYGLKTAVIRALHFMYPPYMERIKSVTTFEVHPDILRKRQCILAWYKKQKEHWIYYFKMKQKTGCILQHRQKQGQPDLLEILDDITVNPDANCRVLQVTCSHFSQVPPVIGLTLSSVIMTLSKGFRHHRLQIHFNSGINLNSKLMDESSRTIILDPVINIKILDWWHPTYPHNNNIDNLLNREY